MSKIIANTILDQLGDNRFIAMTGAKNFSVIMNGLQFSLSAGGTKNRNNMVRIRLNGRDLYDIEVGKFSTRTFDFAISEQAFDIPVENLQEVFTRLTGLYTRL
jgi:hypothetical protein